VVRNRPEIHHTTVDCRENPAWCRSRNATCWLWKVAQPVARAQTLCCAAEVVVGLQNTTLAQSTRVLYYCQLGLPSSPTYGAYLSWRLNRTKTSIESVHRLI